MKKTVSMIFEDWFIDEGGNYGHKVKSENVSFCDRNSIYIESCTYDENFDKFVQDVMECGYVYLDCGKVVTVNQIKFFVPRNSNHKKRKNIRRNIAKVKK